MDLEKLLREALAPCEPGRKPEVAVMAHLTALRSRPRRLVVITSVFALAAAAAMLAVSLRDSGSPAPVVAAPAIEIPEISAAEAPASEATPDEATPDSALENVPTPARAVLFLDDLQTHGENEEALGQIREFYDTMEQGLRAIPGLMVVRANQADLSDVHVDFQLTVFGTREQERWGVTAQLQRPGKPEAGQNMMATGTDLPSVCASPARRPEAMCVSAADLARGVVFGLHLDLLPDDTTFRKGLRETVLDASGSFRNRFNALEQLSHKAAGDMDAAVIRAALDLIGENPRSTERMLDMLRGHSDPALLSMLIDMAYLHPVSTVRAHALSMLIDEYNSHPAARSAIESLAVGDRMTLLTHVAERAISGDGQWNAYVIATVKDSSLPPSQRFAPLAYLMQTKQKDDVRRLLDDDFIAALKDVLPDVVGGKDESEALSAFGVMALIPDGNTPAVIDLMLATWDGASNARASRVSLMFAIDRLLMHRTDPRVHGRLAEIAASDPDPQLRKRAAEAL